ncbi:MAG: class I SAM-dependent methyltransferase [Alphaproteobacteria bacterium]|nr:class I SAM-dependent methyltransferase [Alphaproteobacteria bacterium]
MSEWRAWAASVDFGRTASDYASHRAGFPEPMFDRLMTAGIARPGDQLLDLGTGTGSLARGFARRGLSVTGLDPAENMLAEARRLDREAGVTVDHRLGRAEATGFDAGAFDVVAAGQCWHWFDRAKAAAEARRVLVSGGKLVVAHFDWLPLPGSVAAASETLILEFNPRWIGAGGTGVHPRTMTDAAIAGFRQIESFSFDHDVFYTHEGWAGRIRASAGVAATLDPQAVATFDQRHRALLAERFPVPKLAVPHRVWVMTAKSTS